MRYNIGKVLCAIIVFLFVFFLHYADAQEQVEIEADNIVYQPSDNILMASGNVEAEFRGFRIFANDLLVNYNRTTLSLKDGYRINYKNSTIKGDTLNLNYEAYRGVAKNTEITAGRQSLKGIEIRIFSDKVNIEEGYYSTCPEPEKHYYFKADKVEVFQEVGVIVLHDTYFYLFGIPVLYVPTYIFGGTRYGLLTSQTPLPEIGYNEEDGFFVKERLGYFISKQNSGTFNLGYIKKKGFYAGLSHQYLPDDSNNHTVDFTYYTGREYPLNFDIDYLYERKWGVTINQKKNNGFLNVLSDEKEVKEPEPIINSYFNLAYRKYINFQYVTFKPRLGFTTSDYNYKNLFNIRGAAEVARLSENEGPTDYKLDMNVDVYRSLNIIAPWGTITPGLSITRQTSTRNEWSQILGSLRYSTRINDIIAVSAAYYHKLYQQGQRSFLYDSYNVFGVNYVDFKLDTTLQPYEFSLRYKYDVEHGEFLDLEQSAGIASDCMKYGIKYRLLDKQFGFYFSIY